MCNIGLKHSAVNIAKPDIYQLFSQYRNRLAPWMAIKKTSNIEQGMSKDEAGNIGL
jgi:hypothetical protein